MNRMKRAICMALAVLSAVSMTAGVSASQVYYLPDVTAEMSEAAFWTQDSDVLMTEGEIARSNKQVIAAEETNMYDLKSMTGTVDGIALNEALKKSAQADASYYLGWTYLEDQKLATQADFDAIIENTQNPGASHQQKIRYGIAVKRTALRAFPSELAIWDDLNDTDFDYQYLVGIRVNEPVVITSVSGDGKYYLAKNVCCSGWIPVEDEAVLDNRTEGWPYTI